MSNMYHTWGFMGGGFLLIYWFDQIMVMHSHTELETSVYHI